MKNISTQLLSLFISIVVTACSLPPKPFDDDAQSQMVNKNLVCAKQIDILRISINGAGPPKASFDLSMKKLKKYTTDNIILHKSINLEMEEQEINPFIHILGADKRITYLNPAERSVLQKALAKLPKQNSSIVMIFTPRLSPDIGDNDQSRGIAFNNRDKYRVVAYNQSTIDHAPVISKTQSWKIVLTHELGHQLAVPAASTHNKDAHCTTRQCVMYSSPDWQSVVSVFFHGMPYDFCYLCKAELINARKECRVPLK